MAEHKIRYDGLLVEPSLEVRLVHEAGTILDVNPACEQTSGYRRSELIGRNILDVISNESRPAAERILRDNSQGEFELAVIHGDRSRRIYRVLAYGDTYKGRPVRVAVGQDITELRETQKVLEAVREELSALRSLLVNKDAALQEIINQIETEKRRQTAQIQSNISRIALPVLKMIQERVGDVEGHYVRLLESCLIDIVSPFISDLEAQHPQLSPREIEICNMIKNGLLTKEIAAALNTSVETVATQRKLIRKKLRLAHRKINLVSYLKSLGQSITRE